MRKNGKAKTSTAVAMFSFFLSGGPTLADVCDYRPSQLLGGGGAGAVAVAGRFFVSTQRNLLKLSR